MTITQLRVLFATIFTGALLVMLHAQAPTTILNPSSDLAGKTLVTAEGNRTISGTFTYTVPVLFANGTTGAPGVAASADATTGWGLTVGSISGSLGGTQRFLLNGSGLTIYGVNTIDNTGIVNSAALGSGSPTATTYLSGARTWTAPPLVPMLFISTSFETSTRFSVASNVNTGTEVFDTTGVQLQTGAGATSSAGLRWNHATVNGGFFNGSPRLTAHLSLTTKGTDCQFYVGIGAITTAGAGLTFTDLHTGFKIVWASSGAASLFATQGSGAAETASATLTTMNVNDDVDLILQMNGSTSVDYYFRKNGSALSAATNLATNVPTGNNSAYTPHMAISNTGVASATTITMTGMSLLR